MAARVPVPEKMACRVLFPGAAVTNCGELMALRQHTLILSQDGGQKSEIKVLAVLVPSGEPICSEPLPAFCCPWSSYVS